MTDDIYAATVDCDHCDQPATRVYDSGEGTCDTDDRTMGPDASTQERSRARRRVTRRTNS